MTTPAIRSALRRIFGDRKYRVTAVGEIHVYGQIPNSEETGWYLYGFSWDPNTIRSIEALATYSGRLENAKG